MRSSLRGNALTSDEIEHFWLPRLQTITERYPFINVAWIPAILVPLIGFFDNFNERTLIGVGLIWLVYLTFSFWTYWIWHQWRESKKRKLQLAAVGFQIGWYSATLAIYSIHVGWLGLSLCIQDPEIANKFSQIILGLVACLILTGIATIVFGSVLNRTLHPEMFPQLDVKSDIQKTGRLTVIVATIVQPLLIVLGVTLGKALPATSFVLVMAGALLLMSALYLFIEAVLRSYQLAILLTGKRLA